MALQPVQLVQIGAYVGDSGNDPLFELFRRYAADPEGFHDRRAILAEPVARYYRQLFANCLQFPFLQCENVAVGPELALRPLYALTPVAEARRAEIPEWTSQLGSFLPHRVSELWDSYEHAKRPDDGDAIRAFLNANTVAHQVLTVTLDQLLLKNGWESFDALQIDAEGYDYEILRTVDFGRHRPVLINYERVLLRDQEAEARSLLTAHGYKLYDTYADTLGVRSDFMHLV